MRLSKQNEEEGLQEGLDQCMQSFLKSRSDIHRYLYSDSLPCLASLRQAGIKIGVLSNGNCDFHLNEDLHRGGGEGGLLQDFLDFSLSATDTGCAKPSLIGFLACLQRLPGIPPQRVLFVGDDYEKDVVGAARAGMKTLFLLRNEQLYEEILSDNSHPLHPTRSEQNQIDYLVKDLSLEQLDSILNIDSEK